MPNVQAPRLILVRKVLTVENTNARHRIFRCLVIRMSVAVRLAVPVISVSLVSYCRETRCIRIAMVRSVYRSQVGRREEGLRNVRGSSQL